MQVIQLLALFWNIENLIVSHEINRKIDKLTLILGILASNSSEPMHQDDWTETKSESDVGDVYSDSDIDSYNDETDSIYIHNVATGLSRCEIANRLSRCGPLRVSR